MSNERYGMACPICGENAKVVGHCKYEIDMVKRTRVCTECGHKFRTVEIDEDMLKSFCVRKKEVYPYAD